MESIIHYQGGRCELNEDSVSTATRELKEETGLDSTFLKSIGIIENFFESSFNKKNYHEILMIHELEFKNKNVYEQTAISNIEENKKEHLTYLWIDINELKKSNFKPAIVLEMIRNNNFQHIILKEIQ